ncbi:MAG: aminotransferase class I/II-fold pyridoxal phosphate-dependent enzyme [Actinomycetota bacterium]|nr:aminotransferase class I/II-fold pyridoxal phosphate-dependent enzyme [Actinomycetota bacterium]
MREEQSIGSKTPGLTAGGQSATLAINELSRELENAGNQVFKFGFGQSPFPVPEEVVEELRAHSAEKDYLPIRGLPSLREEASAHLERQYGLKGRAQDVLIGPGSKELMFLLQLALDTDLLIPAPSWVSYAPQARILGRSVHLLPTHLEDDWRVDPDILDELCSREPGRSRLLILTDPSNPTGTSHSADQHQELAAVARKHGIICLSDEIYAGLCYNPGHSSMARWYPEGTVVSTGLSKWCGAGGWRLGVFQFPAELDWLADGVAVLASETFTSVSAPVQYAAVRAYQGSEAIDEYLIAARRVLSALAARVTERLRAAGVAVADPVGGFYVFPDFGSKATALESRGITTSSELCRRLLDETGVALLPGSSFNLPPTRLTARLAFVDFDGAVALEEALRQPAGELSDAFVDKHLGNTIQGVERLCEWLG